MWQIESRFVAHTIQTTIIILAHKSSGRWFIIQMLCKQVFKPHGNLKHIHASRKPIPRPIFIQYKSTCDVNMCSSFFRIGIERLLDAWVDIVHEWRNTANNFRYSKVGALIETCAPVNISKNSIIKTILNIQLSLCRIRLNKIYHD